MIVLRYEKSHFIFNASRCKSRASDSLCFGGPGGMDRFKNSRPIADTGGSASGMDSRSVGLDASELESLDAQDKRARDKGITGEIKNRASFAVNVEHSPETGGGFGEEAFRTRDKSRSMGRPHSCCPPKTAFWRKNKGSPGSVLASPIRVLPEACRLLVYSGAFKRSEEIPRRFKKNSSFLNRTRRLYLKTKRGLRCILGSAGYGQRKENECVFLPPAIMLPGLIFSAGLRLFWAKMAW